MTLLAEDRLEPVDVMPKTGRRNMPVASLRRSAALFLCSTPNALSQEELAAISSAVKARIADAGRLGLTPADVVRSLLQPILDASLHCRCAACQERCDICRYQLALAR